MLALISFALALFSPSPVFARDVLRIGVDNVANGYVMRDGHEVLVGSDVDYMQMLAAYADMDYEFVLGPIPELTEKLDNGEIDVMTGRAWIKERAELYDYSDLPTSHSVRLLYLHDGVDTASKVLKIGFLREAYASPDIKEYLAHEGINYESVLFETSSDVFAAYDANDIDGFIMTDRVPLKYIPARRFDPRDLYFIVKKGNRAVFTRLNEAQRNLKMNEPSLVDDLYVKYQSQSVRGGLMLTREEMEYLKEKGTLRAVVVLTGAPFAYERGGKLAGVAASLIDDMETNLGVDIETIAVDYNRDAWTLIKNGEADFVLNQYMNYRIARENDLSLTNKYRTVSYVAMVRNGSKPVDHPIVAVRRNNIRSKKFEQRRFDENQLRFYDTDYDCMKAVQRGEVDVTFTQDLMAQYAIWQGDFPDLMAVGRGAFTHGTCMAVRSDNAMMLSILDKEIGQLGDDKINRYIEIEQQKMNDSRSVISLVYAYPLRFILGGFVVIVIIALLCWRMLTIRRRHLNHVRTMLYKDRYTGYHNRVWLEAEGKKQISGLSKEDQDRVAAVAFSMCDRVNFVSMYGNSRLDTIMHDLAVMLEKEPWVMTIATDSREGHVHILTRPMYIENLKQAIESFFQKEEYFSVGSIKGRIFFTAGISMLGFNSGAISAAVNHADAASHFGEAGHDNIVVYDEDMHEAVIFEQLVTELMDSALEKEEFQVWMQPKYDLRTHRCTGAETLVRWDSPDLGFLMPGKFIGIFEKNGFVSKLDFYMLDKTYQYQQARYDAGLPVVPISVNQSRIHMQEEDYLDKMRAIISRYTVKDAVELEITETAFDFGSNAQREASIHVVKSLKEMGYRILMDDFGTGYSDIALLNVLPMDVMKIDRSILIAPGDSERKKNLLTLIAQMGHGFGMDVICEGIETEEQEKLLIECGCEYGQGYLYGKPMKEEDYTTFLETHL
ncbi:MAG: EAL domain-containing protein [Selenomonadaceae bacterium]